MKRVPIPPWHKESWTIPCSLCEKHVRYTDPCFSFLARKEMVVLLCENCHKMYREERASKGSTIPMIIVNSLPIVTKCGYCSRRLSEGMHERAYNARVHRGRGMVIVAVCKACATKQESEKLVEKYRISNGVKRHISKENIPLATIKDIFYQVDSKFPGTVIYVSTRREMKMVARMRQIELLTGARLQSTKSHRWWLAIFFMDEGNHEKEEISKLIDSRLDMSITIKGGVFLEYEKVFEEYE